MRISPRLAYAALAYVTADTQVHTANQKLRSLNLSLDREVEVRTAELKKTSDQLVHDRYLLNTLVETIPDPVFFKNRKLEFIRVNAAMAKIAGYDDPAELIGKTDADFRKQSSADESAEDERYIMRTGESIVNKEEQPIEDGQTERWVLVTKMPLRNETKEIVGTFGIARDITEIKKAELKLQESEARFRRIVETAPEAVVILDVDEGRIRSGQSQRRAVIRSDQRRIDQTSPVRTQSGSSTRWDVFGNAGHGDDCQGTQR